MTSGLVTIALFLAAGWPCARSLAWPRRVAEAFLLGAGIAFALLLGESLLHVPWSRLTLVVPMLVVVVVGAVFRRATLAPARARLHWLDAVSLVLVAGYARFATLAPTPVADFITIWGVKAKEFFLAGGIDWSWLSQPFNEFAHVDYPLLVPLTFDAQTLIAGAWPDRWLGMMNVAFGVAAVLMLRGFLADTIAKPWLAAMATVALAWTALSPWIGLAEGPLVAYGTAGALFVRKGEVSRGALFLGLAACCKNEGLTLIVAAAAGMLAAGMSRAVWRLWPAVAIASPWLVLRSAHHLQTDLTSSGVAARVVQHLENLTPMFRAMAEYSVGKPLFWSGIAVALLLGIRRLPRERFLVVLIVVQLAFFIGAYLATPHDVTWHVRWSWERIVTQLAALIGFLAVVVLAPEVDDLAPLY